MRCRFPLLVLALLAASTALLGTGSPSSSSAGSAAVPEEIPAEAKNMKNPQEATPQSIADGKQIYSSQCAMCHGANGDGKGDLAIRFGYEMPDFTNPGVQKSATDGEYFYILSHGHGKMSGEEGRLGATTRWNLVNYIRTLDKN